VVIEEVAKRIGKSKSAVYKMIAEKRGLGKHFKKNQFGVWVIDGRRVSK
jgi:predicted DNA-binding transcriptional regulator AlpA